MEWMEYIQKGGVIMQILIALNVLGWAIMGWKFLQLLFVRAKKPRLLASLIVEIRKKEVPLHDEHIVKELIGDELAYRMNRLESGLPTVKIIASIAPLLGLLGTVIGVLMAFEAISKVGMGDPGIFAGGISLALVTTIGGLIVAIPHYIGYNYLIGMIDALEVEIEKEILPALYHDESLVAARNG